MTETERTRVAFRVDAGFRLGLGHLARCLTLAAELARRGAAIEFITRRLPDPMADRILQCGYRHRVVPDAVTALPAPGGVWTIAAQERDAHDVLLRMPGRVNVLVVDHYGLDTTWETLVAPNVDSVVVIDDLANRAHACDVLIDQNWSGPGTAGRYDGFVGGACRVLVGPRYALLEPIYGELRRSANKAAERERRIVVSFGGSDPSQETSKVLDAIADMDLADWDVDVVLGAGSSDTVEDLSGVTSRSNISLHSDLPTLATLFSMATLAVGAGGITTWERLCLGVPSIVTTVAPNQVPAAAALHDAGAIVWIGGASETTPATYRTYIASAVIDGLPPPPALVDGWERAVWLWPSSGYGVPRWSSGRQRTQMPLRFSTSSEGLRQSKARPHVAERRGPSNWLGSSLILRHPIGWYW